MLKLIEQKYKWNGELERRTATKYIIVHHRAGNGDAQSIHQGHLELGYTGIGYHFYVRKDGTVYKGRPIATVGAHCVGANSLGVCFEGNYEKETKMPPAQCRAGKALISYLKGLYPLAEVRRHKDFYATACPGSKFPFEEIRKGESEMTVDEAIEIIQAKAGVEEGTIDFLLCYKYGEELVIKLAEAMR